MDSVPLSLSLVSAAVAGLCIAAAGVISPASPAQAIVSVTAGLVLFGASLMSFRSRWITGKVNEWILVVRNGKMVKAGVGLTVFRGLTDTVVSFPSLIQKVSFTAEQVSKEVQGLRVHGFCIWSINRVEDGPFKAYRYLDGLSQAGLTAANDNIAKMCESILRSAVANMGIHEVIRNREAMRDKVKQDMSAIVSGWGVWLETVEVTEVTVCSKSLFDDMQVEFRQSSRQSAELTKLKAQKLIDEGKVQSSLALSKMRADADSQASIYAAKKQLDQAVARAEIEEKEHQLKMAAGKRDTELARSRMDDEEALEMVRVQRRLEREAVQANQDLELLKRKLQEEKAMSQASLQRLTLDTAKDIYKKLPLQSVKLVNITGGGGGGAGGGSFDSLLPGLMGLQAATAAAGRDS